MKTKSKDIANAALLNATGELPEYESEMTPSDIYYADILALCDKHPANVTEFDIKLLQDHARKTCTPDGVVMSVIEKCVTRSMAGIENYGMTMGGNPGDKKYWLENLQEELQDSMMYIERLLSE